MSERKRVVVAKNFWYATADEPDTDLYEDQLGWTIPIKVESGGYTDTYEVWRAIMGGDDQDMVGWDLCFYFPETKTFYYIDQIDKVLFKLPVLDDWDGKSIFCSVEIKPQVVDEELELMDFDNVSEVWDNFKIDGKDMKYILEHSALFLST